jgi:hypothetical protein
MREGRLGGRPSSLTAKRPGVPLNVPLRYDGTDQTQMFRLRLSHQPHRHAQTLARRNDQARHVAHYNSQTGAWEMIERGVTRYNPQTGVWASGPH